MHPSGTGSAQAEKDKGGQQPVRESSAANLGGKVNGSQLAAATATSHTNGETK